MRRESQLYAAVGERNGVKCDVQPAAIRVIRITDTVCATRAEGETAWQWSLTDGVARSESRASALLRVKYDGK
ncbi:hypothetical protein C6Q15_03680 [Burkholderia multivorans]|uniref:Uncharacterized protein n=1 Tax=Burkholderia multivorans TaxID=87883 RepID=A0A2S9N001_9BURK|nr:hypothetical protein C6Q07_29770 [Burkholderia multivorans]PRF65576.1 hypothetical protein C6Q15_03680 [Burkholderia multivorans]